MPWVCRDPAAAAAWPRAEPRPHPRGAQLAEELGAATAVLTGSDVAPSSSPSRRARLNCATLVLGPRQSGHPAGAACGWWRGCRWRARLAQLAPALDILEVGRADGARRLSRSSLGGAGARIDSDDKAPITLAGYAWAAATSVALTLLCTPLTGVLAAVRTS